MIPLILTILFVHIAVHIVNTIGATTIDTLLWLIYLKFPTSTSAKAREQNRLKREVLQLKYDMNNTSSQDEFAKWAKLRRRHDKSLEEFETMNKSLVSQKTSFEWTVKIARWISTTGLRLFLQFYYAKTPVFVLPSGWFPYYIEWILAFPRAPLGSVSVQIWSGVCTAAIALIADMITSIYLLVTSGVTGLLATGKTASEARAKKAQ